ncbi:MAG: flagellar hook-length control protein FliK [Lentisphaerae bacterium]|nr:MAG: flagellar hook-length control protein FliK [Lentisphaerota bacterium]
MESGPLPEQRGDEGIHHDLDAQKRDSQKTVVVERKPTRPSSFIQEKPEVISTPDRSPSADSDSDEEILDVAPRKNAFGGGPTPTSSISWEHFDNQIDQSLFPRMQQIAEVLRNSPELHRSQQNRAEQPDSEVLSDFNLRHFRLSPRAAFPQPQSPENSPVSKDHTGTILDLLSRLRHEVIRKQTGGKAEPVRIAQPVMPGITAQEKNTKMPDPTGTFYMPRGTNAKIPGKGTMKRQLHEIRRALPATVPHPGKTSHAPQTISTQPSPSNPLRVNRDEAIQELVQVLRDHLPAPPLHTAAQQLDLQFSSTRFGNLSITLQHQNDRLEIVLQSSQEQTQQELMQSREELARQLRQLGYQQVQIQVLSRDPRQGGSNPRSGHQTSAGDSDDDRRIRFVDEDGNELDEDV